jgi:hypothetical protein
MSRLFPRGKVKVLAGCKCHPNSVLMIYPKVMAKGPAILEVITLGNNLPTVILKLYFRYARGFSLSTAMPEQHITTVKQRHTRFFCTRPIIDQGANGTVGLILPISTSTKP